jgi:hypothetical protein
MYYFEWGCWQAMLETDEDRKNDHELDKKLGLKKHVVYESDAEEEETAARLCVSETPKARGPVYVFNDTVLEMRCGIWEAKRGLVTILSAMPFIIISQYSLALIPLIPQIIDVLSGKHSGPYGNLFFQVGFFAGAVLLVSWIYFKYCFRFSRLEMFTSRHLLIRFNRKTQQVYLHRPSYCGGIMTLPWKGVTSSGANQRASEAAGLGVPLSLFWPERVTGTLHPVMACVGKMGNNQSELRNEWEFIRRFMDEGPKGLPRPRITSHFPWPWQAFTPQFEGLAHLLHNTNRTSKVGLLLIFPAFVVFGLGHWVSLMLCWKPHWPKLIRQAGLPGKPVPPQTNLADYPPQIQERLRANVHLWAVRPGKRPEKKPRTRRGRRSAATE